MRRARISRSSSVSGPSSRSRSAVSKNSLPDRTALRATTVAVPRRTTRIESVVTSEAAPGAMMPRRLRPVIALAALSWISAAPSPSTRTPICSGVASMPAPESTLPIPTAPPTSAAESSCAKNARRASAADSGAASLKMKVGITWAAAAARSSLSTAASLGTSKPATAMMSLSATVPAWCRPMKTPGSEG